MHLDIPHSSNNEDIEAVSSITQELIANGNNGFQTGEPT
jgi:hypothetical protein